MSGVAIRLSVEKFQEVVCGERQIQLVVFIDTRKMTLALPKAKYHHIHTLLVEQWHIGKKRFRPLDAAPLLGLLYHQIAMTASSCKASVLASLSCMQAAFVLIGCLITALAITF